MKKIIKFIERENVPSDYDEIMEKEAHHNHRIIEDEHGILRWEKDDFVRELIDSTDFNRLMDELQMKGADRNSELYRELYRRIGYSLSGYWEIFYWEMNNEDAALYKPPKSHDLK